MLYLKALNEQDAAQEYAFLQAMPSENGFMNDVYGLPYDEFVRRVIPRRLAYSRGEDLAPGHVPDTWYFLWQDDAIVGLFKLRPALNDVLRSGSGHMGYGIHPAHRCRGYATQGLRLAIELLRRTPAFTDSEVLLSCSVNNPASLRVMLKCGGAIHRTDHENHYVRIPL